MILKSFLLTNSRDAWVFWRVEEQIRGAFKRWLS